MVAVTDRQKSRPKEDEQAGWAGRHSWKQAVIFASADPTPPHSGLKSNKSKGPWENWQIAPAPSHLLQARECLQDWGHMGWYIRNCPQRSPFFIFSCLPHLRQIISSPCLFAIPMCKMSKNDDIHPLRHLCGVTRFCKSNLWSMVIF